MSQLELYFHCASCTFRQLIWALDGAIAHRLLAVRNHSQEPFEGHSNRTESRCGMASWVTRFNTLGYLKTKVFTTPSPNLQDCRPALSTRRKI